MQKTKELVTLHLLSFNGSNAIETISLSPGYTQSRTFNPDMHEFTINLKNHEKNQETCVPYSYN